MASISAVGDAAVVVQNALQELDVLRSDSCVFFESLKSEMAKTCTSFLERIAAVERALCTSSHEPVSRGIKFDALLDEIEMEHRSQAAALNGSVSDVGAATPTNTQQGRGGGPLDSSHYSLHGSQPNSSLRHGTLGGTRGGDDRLDASDPNISATPTRRFRPPAADDDGEGRVLAPLLPSGEPKFNVLVEFKRNRVLQFESDRYVSPGEYVVVGGDRGEDIGLVTYSWNSSGGSNNPPASQPPPTPVRQGTQVGAGKVLRVATSLEVAQLQGVQAELENRAKEVAQLKVIEHHLPMKIVDAEYQFDRKKLTFFYQSQHRLDFRVLVRDLYKTFRARIWMELE